MNVFDVKQFGAVGNLTGSESEAIQAAIDACHAVGGGIVHVPAGDYRIGYTELKSGVTLHLDTGATLWASDNVEDYPGDRLSAYNCRILIHAVDADRIGLEGRGCIRGFGTETFGSWWGVPEPPPLRVCTLLFERCHHIAIRDVTIRDSSFWTIHLDRCDTVYIDHIRILNFRYHLNADGIDPDGSRNVFITGCHISTGDDSIVLKSTSGEPCENVFVTDCVLESPCTAIKLGTESYGIFRNIHFTNCSIINSAIGIGLFMKDGGIMEQIRFSGMTIENADLYSTKPVMPLFVDIEKRHADSKVGRIRDIAFQDLWITTRSSALLQGMPESPLENMRLQNVTMRIDGPLPFEGRSKPITGRRTVRDERDTRFIAKPAYITLAYCDDVDVENLRIYVPNDVAADYPRHAVYAFAANHLLAEKIRISPPREDIQLVRTEK